MKDELGFGYADKDYDFNHRISDEIIVNLSLSYESDKLITSIQGATFPSSLIEELKPVHRYGRDKLSDHAKSTLDFYLQISAKSSLKLIQTIKYYMCHYGINEQMLLAETHQWGTSETELFHVPTKLNATSYSLQITPINDETSKLIQATINSNVLPLKAMRYLHRARRESLPNYKWIDATTAAELAIKEALCIKQPLLEKLLLEMPSPPLSKLYGDVMKTYFGESSPFRKKLAEGQEIRNRLVHRHTNEVLTFREAHQFVETVEASIFHLMSLLYPNDRLLECDFLNRKK